MTTYKTDYRRQNSIKLCEQYNFTANKAIFEQAVNIRRNKRCRRNIIRSIYNRTIILQSMYLEYPSLTLTPWAQLLTLPLKGMLKIFRSIYNEAVGLDGENLGLIFYFTRSIFH
ncbi:hypothetical protein V6Z12_D11G143700 [Gossypium hirsutum]